MNGKYLGLVILAVLFVLMGEREAKACSPAGADCTLNSSCCSGYCKWTFGDFYCACPSDNPYECGGECYGCSSSSDVFTCKNGAAHCCPSGYPYYCPIDDLCHQSSSTCKSCTDECSTAGTTKCLSDTAQETCGDYNLDDCLEWGAGMSCNCSNNKCQFCSNECNSGDTGCDTFGTQRWECQKNSATGCWEKHYYNCGTGKTCFAGLCVDNCTNDCSTQGSTHCISNGTAQETCGYHDSDNCLEWGAGVSCYCYDGECHSEPYDSCETTKCHNSDLYCYDNLGALKDKEEECDKAEPPVTTYVCSADKKQVLKQVASYSYSCANGACAKSSSLDSSIYATCGDKQFCSGEKCVDDCSPAQDQQACNNSTLVWQDACGKQTSVIEDCSLKKPICNDKNDGIWSKGFCSAMDLVCYYSDKTPCQCGCVNSACQAPCCQDECKLNEKGCQDGQNVKWVCGLNNGCYKRQPTNCQSNEVCLDGACQKIELPCQMVKAYWHPPVAADEDIVQLKIETTGACANQNIKISIYEDDGLLKDDFQIGKLVALQAGLTTTDWTVVYIDDQWGTPEYYFEFVYQGKTITSDLLTVFPKEIELGWVKNILEKHPPEYATCSGFSSGFGLSMDCIKIASIGNEEPSQTEEMLDAAGDAAMAGWIGSCAACAGVLVLKGAACSSFVLCSLALSASSVGCGVCIGEADMIGWEFAKLFRALKLGELFNLIKAKYAGAGEIFKIDEAITLIIKNEPNEPDEIIWDSIVASSPTKFQRYQFKNPIWGFKGGPEFMDYNGMMVKGLFGGYSKFPYADKKFVASLFTSSPDQPETILDIYNVPKAWAQGKIKSLPKVEFVKKGTGPDTSPGACSGEGKMSEIYLNIDYFMSFSYEEVIITDKQQAINTWLHEFIHFEQGQFLEIKGIPIVMDMGLERNPMVEYLCDYRILKLGDSDAFINGKMVKATHYLPEMKDQNRDMADFNEETLKFKEGALENLINLYYSSQSAMKYFLTEIYKKAELTGDEALLQAIRDGFIAKMGKTAWLEFVDEAVLAEEAVIKYSSESMAGSGISIELLDLIKKFFLNVFPSKLSETYQIIIPRGADILHEGCYGNDIWWLKADEGPVVVKEECDENTTCFKGECVENNSSGEESDSGNDVLSNNGYPEIADHADVKAAVPGHYSTSGCSFSPSGDGRSLLILFFNSLLILFWLRLRRT